jgi:xylulokinase
MANGGAMVEWYCSVFGGKGTVTQASGGEALAGVPLGIEKIPPGAGGVIVLPHLIGATAPHSDPDYSACILGIRTGTTGASIFRAILEAAAFEVRWNLDVLQEMGEKVDRLRMIGGGTKSHVWPQIVADVIGIPVDVPRERECAAMGAARMALEAVGVAAAETAERVQVQHTFTPDARRAAVYDQLFPLYQQAFSTLKQPLHALAGLSFVKSANSLSYSSPDP